MRLRKLTICLAFSIFLTLDWRADVKAVEIHPGDLIVVDSHNQSSPGHGTIVRIDPVTGVQTLVATTTRLEQPARGGFDIDGTIVLADSGVVGSGGVYRVNPATGAQTLISSGQLVHPIDVVRDSAGNLIVTQQGTTIANGAVFKVNPSTGMATPVASGPLFGVTESIALEPDGNYLVSNFQGSTAGSSIVRVDATTGAASVVSSGGMLASGPRGISLDILNAHSLLVAQTDHLLRIDTTTGAQSVISSEGMFSLLTDVTQNATGDIFAIDYATASVIRVDSQTGVQTLISSGGMLSTPLAIFVFVPEPATVILSIPGVLVFFAVAWRRFVRGAATCSSSSASS